MTTAEGDHTLLTSDEIPPVEPPFAPHNSHAVAAVKLRGVSATRMGRQVLQRADLAVALGEMVACTGSDPDSRTALLGVVAGLTPPDEGEVEVMGVSLDPLTLEERRCFLGRGLVVSVTHVEAYCLIPHLSVEQSIMKPLQEAGLSRSKQDEYAHDLMRCVGLFRRAAETVGALDAYGRRKLAIAKALVSHPRLLLLDRPEAGLSAGQTWSVMACLVAIRHGGISLLISTDREDVARWADRTVAINGVEVPS